MVGQNFFPAELACFFIAWINLSMKKKLAERVLNTLSVYVCDVLLTIILHST